MCVQDAESKYRLPYEVELGENISIEALQEFVASKKGRPLLKEAWKNNTVSIMLLNELINCKI